jgi:hypothetical protein
VSRTTVEGVTWCQGQLLKVFFGVKDNCIMHGIMSPVLFIYTMYIQMYILGLCNVCISRVLLFYFCHLFRCKAPNNVVSVRVLNTQLRGLMIFFFSQMILNCFWI